MIKMGLSMWLLRAGGFAGPGWDCHAGSQGRVLGKKTFAVCPHKGGGRVLRLGAGADGGLGQEGVGPGRHLTSP